jgi:hypothetical protein
MLSNAQTAFDREEPARPSASTGGGCQIVRAGRDPNLLECFSSILALMWFGARRVRRRQRQH